MTNGESMRDRDRAEFEMLASGSTSHSGITLPKLIGDARAELLRRDREYAEGLEDSRRRWEAEREQSGAHLRSIYFKRPATVLQSSRSMRKNWLGCRLT